jgi:hypothetical protein
MLMNERYANYIFHAYHERYCLEINAEYAFKGFIYSNLTDLRNARPGHNTAMQQHRFTTILITVGL